MPRPQARSIVVMSAVCPVLLLAACGGSDESGGGEGDSWNLTYATQHTENTPYSRATAEWAELVEERTDGRVTVDISYGESLLDAAEVLPGIAEGRADAGFVVDSMYQNQLPLTSASSIPFDRTNGVAQALAFHQMYRDNEQYRAEWEDLGVHMLHFQPSAPAAIGSNDPIETLDDLAGKSIRCLGFICNALQGIGANPVAISSAEIYEAMERGTIDGWTAYPFQDILANQFQEVTEYVTDPGMGAYIQASTPINLEVWNSLPADVQDTLTELSEEYYDIYVEQANQLERETCEATNEAGVELSIMPESETQAWEEQVRDDIYAEWVGLAGEEAESFYEDFTAAYDEAAASSDYESLYPQCVDGTL